MQEQTTYLYDTIMYLISIGFAVLIFLFIWYIIIPYQDAKNKRKQKAAFEKKSLEILDNIFVDDARDLPGIRRQGSVRSGS